MPVYVRYGRASTKGSFPRWGYLDKYFTNDRMPWALLIASTLFLGIMGGWLGWQKFEEWRRGKAATVAAGKRQIKYLNPAELGVPPSLTEQKVQSLKVEVKQRPKFAMPVPVPDEEAVEETIASLDEMATAGPATQTGFGMGDSLVINASDMGLPSPDEYVAFEKAPDLVSMEPVVYPDLAREAGVEGTVLIRVLVGEDGFVKDAMIVQSIPMLDSAAADAAWTAVFKPALQKDRPVAVWMVIPIEFSLRG